MCNGKGSKTWPSIEKQSKGPVCCVVKVPQHMCASIYLPIAYMYLPAKY